MTYQEMKAVLWQTLKQGIHQTTLTATISMSLSFAVSCKEENLPQGHNKYDTEGPSTLIRRQGSIQPDFGQGRIRSERPRAMPPSNSEYAAPFPRERFQPAYAAPFPRERLKSRAFLKKASPAKVPIVNDSAAELTEKYGASFPRPEGPKQLAPSEPRPLYAAPYQRPKAKKNNPVTPTAKSGTLQKARLDRGIPKILYAASFPEVMDNLR